MNPGERDADGEGDRRNPRTQRSRSSVGGIGFNNCEDWAVNDSRR
jgi:hypothetical protein